MRSVDTLNIALATLKNDTRNNLLVVINKTYRNIKISANRVVSSAFDDYQLCSTGVQIFN